jgi:PleD family two-component response regulator
MRKKQKVLAVDDNHLDRLLLEKILETDYEFLTVDNGVDALAICSKEDIDLILLDINMPEMDGYEVCKSLKANLTTNHIPVIFITGRTTTEDIVQGFKVGGVDYVSKPYKSVELLARISTHIELKTLRGILPLCCICGLIRDDSGVEYGKGEWMKTDVYFTKMTDINVSHGYCPECLKQVFKK